MIRTDNRYGRTYAAKNKNNRRNNRENNRRNTGVERKEAAFPQFRGFPGKFAHGLIAVPAIHPPVDRCRGAAQTVVRSLA